MEGVGGRLGRSSSRYGGPATVFTGPVRKWTKKWVPLAPSPNNNNNTTTNGHNHLSSNGNSSSAASQANGGESSSSSSSHLLFYKWTPLAPNGGKDNSTPVKANGSKEGPDELPRRRYKYIPVHLLENEKKEATEKEAAESMDEESNSADAEPGTVQLDAKDEVLDGKPDINDLPMDENQDDDPVVRQDLNESLDLSLGLNSHDVDSDSRPEFRDGQSERRNESSRRAK